MQCGGFPVSFESIRENSPIGLPVPELADAFLGHIDSKHEFFFFAGGPKPEGLSLSPTTCD